MKGNKIKLGVIYILIVIILLLLIFSIYLVFKQKEEIQKLKENNIAVEKEKEKIAEECVFDITLKEFNELKNSTKYCINYSKLNLTDVTLNGSSVHIIYYNGNLEKLDGQSGIYINGKQVFIGEANNVINTLSVFDNLLFVKTTFNNMTDIIVYNQNGNRIYDLKNALNKAKLDDPAFAGSQNSKLTLGKIDDSSYNFASGVFTFNTNKECAEGDTYKGSSYKVTYSNETFNQPEFISSINC